jgi:hypothetical protein
MTNEQRTSKAAILALMPAVRRPGCFDALRGRASLEPWPTPGPQGENFQAPASRARGARVGESVLSGGLRTLAKMQYRR